MPPATDPTLELRDLACVRGRRRLFRGLNATLAPGQLLRVTGANGAGKTSLLRILCGELAPQPGAVELAGRPLGDWQPVARARALAVLPQHSVLSFPFTAQEVVQLGRIPHATGASRDAQIVELALRRVDCDYLAQRDYTRLSGGEKQRVQLARVLAQIWEPAAGGERYLLLDEPTASFDLAHQRMTLDIVRELAGAGVGVLMVLHDLNLAARCADHMVLLQCGRIAAAGHPREVLTPEVIRGVFAVDASIGTHPVSGTPLVIT